MEIIKYNNNPKVSVIMSIFNTEIEFVKKSIESILDQTFKNFEFIIVLDGTDDFTEKLVLSYSKKDNRIKVIKNSVNIGLTKSLNKAIHQANGEYIARQDADDISLPFRLEKQLNFMERNKDICLIGGWALKINEQEEVIKHLKKPTNFQKIKKYFYRDNPFIHSTVFVRKRIFSRIGLYDENLRYSQDYDLWIRISQKCKVLNLPVFFIYSRIHKNSINVKFEESQALYNLKIKLKYIKKGIFPFQSIIYTVPLITYLVIPRFLKNTLRKNFFKKSLRGSVIRDGI